MYRPNAGLASKHQGEQELVDFVEIVLKQPFGKLQVIGANFVDFTYYLLCRFYQTTTESSLQKEEHSLW